MDVTTEMGVPNKYRTLKLAYVRHATITLPSDELRMYNSLQPIPPFIKAALIHKVEELLYSQYRGDPRCKITINRLIPFADEQRLSVFFVEQIL